ncbi:MAG: potassium-transporting ATPase subunit KdpC [Candidatus Eremiobacteraeota bacterium]|nr:potassium-transporting ATPase subunit KdpC [Candidatus Eremiobacteraeota bacterium]
MQSPAPQTTRESTLSHLLPAVLFTIVSVIGLGIVYPVVIWLIGIAIFPYQANGSLIKDGDKIVGSVLVGQTFKKPQYFHGHPSAAGKDGYDPTNTGGTNLGPTSKKLIDSVAAAVVALKKDNPDATGPIPSELVTSSASGIDPDITPEGAYYQIPRVAKARGVSPDAVRAIVDAHVRGRTFGILGEPRVNVVELNRALDATKGG